MSGAPTVVVVDYDPEWPRRFAMLAERTWPAVAGVALRIEHVGSTSVPGLAAKPIIDLSVVVPTRADVPRAIAGLSTIGYRHRGNLGIEDREAFDAPADLPRHHLYVCPEGVTGLVNPIAVRNYMRAHPDAVARYGALKKRLAAEFPRDIDRYTIAKTDFLLEILTAAGLTQAQLEEVEKVNRV